MNNTYLLSLFAIIAIYFGLRQYKKYKKNKRREILQELEFPPQWDAILRKKFPLYNLLPDHLKPQLHSHINVFVGEKYFAGFQGVEITDTVRVLIAAQACILLLNRETNSYPHLHVIKVYPQAFVDKGGSVNGLRKIARVGESWLRGAVVLSWNEVVRGAKFEDDGSNVVLHEFAHQLDQETGSANGLPLLQNNNIQKWGAVFKKEFEILRHQTKTGQRSFLDKYGATNPAEFFAVVTEVFIEEPKKLKRKHPELYQELCQYYCLDPINWYD